MTFSWNEGGVKPGSSQIEAQPVGGVKAQEVAGPPSSLPFTPKGSSREEADLELRADPPSTSTQRP